MAEGLLGQLRSAIRISELLLGAKPPLPPQRPPQLQQRGAQPAAAARQPAELRQELLLTLRGCLGSSSETGAGLWHELVTLRACLGPSSEAGRHALRLGVIAALTELLVRASGLSHGYAELVLQAAVNADGRDDAVPSPRAGPGQAPLDRLAAGLGTASDVLARSLRALRPPGPLPPLRKLQAAVSAQPDADRVLLTTTDAIVDAVNSTTDILRRYLNGAQKQGSAAPAEC
ncbi:MAG TPA: hypothetical protein VGR98_22420 [Streptosporangiaceae bacterium]|nr:hypothetical protein [Streptosporangiaceae bacterium]